MIRKTCVQAVKGSVRAFVDTWVEHIGETKEGAEFVGEMVQSTPVASSGGERSQMPTATCMGNSNGNMPKTFVTPVN